MMAAVRRQAVSGDYGRETYSRSAGYNGNNGDAGYGRQNYVYGNTVRKPEIPPRHMPEGSTGHEKRMSRQVQKNRSRALSINTAYAVFLAAAAICAVVICFLYLRLQSETVSRSENITVLQKQLADLTEKNDTAYQAAEDSVDLETVQNRAINELGMVYAAQGSVVPYDSPTGDSVKQYNDIPENGVLAKSGSPAE